VGKRHQGFNALVDGYYGIFNGRSFPFNKGGNVNNGKYRLDIDRTQ